MPFFTVDLDEETRNQLDDLAKATERSASGWMRWIIRQEWERHHSKVSIETSTSDGRNNHDQE